MSAALNRAGSLGSVKIKPTAKPLAQTGLEPTQASAPMPTHTSGHTSAHTIVIGGDNAGSGKSMAAVHFAISLLHWGKTVGLIDLDRDRGTVANFMAERVAWAKQERLQLLMPTIERLGQGEAEGDEVTEADKEFVASVLDDFAQRFDYVVLDSPSNNSVLSELSHARSDTLVTPLKTSGADFDMLASVDKSTKRIKSLGPYSEMVWESRKARAQSKRRSIDWIVMKTFAPLSNGVRREGAALKNLSMLSSRLGFRVVPGLSERTLYRELFHRGLTLPDLRHVGDRFRLGMSHIAARQEVRSVVDCLRLPGLKEKTIV